MNNFDNKLNKKLSKKRKVAFVLLIVQVLVLLGLFTYAWFGSDSDPVIVSDQLYIASSEGLYIELVNHSDPAELNLKDVVKDISQYKVLSQLSSVDGKTLFKRQEEDDIISYVEVENDENYVSAAVMLMNGLNESATPNRAVYVKSFDFKFLTIDDEGNDVEILPTNYIYDAIRLSIEVDESSQSINNMTILAFDCFNTTMNGDNFVDTVTYKRRRDNGCDPLSLTPFSNITQDGSNQFYNLNNAVRVAGLSDETLPAAYTLAGYVESDFKNCLGVQKVNYISDFMKLNNQDPSRYITVIDSSRSKKFTVRLWLEGADPECTLDLTGTKIYLKVVFGSDLVAMTSDEFTHNVFGIPEVLN